MQFRHCAATVKSGTPLQVIIPSRRRKSFYLISSQVNYYPLEIEGFLLPDMIETMVKPAPMGDFGPSAVGFTGCEFRTSLGMNAFDRITEKKSSEKAVSAIAFDAATAKSEILGEISIYKLLVKESVYEDKLTGELVRDKTLVSPITEEPISVAIDAGENETGSPEEYQRILSRAKRLAETSGDASMFWVSPGEETDSNIASHRAYLWIKKGNEVTAYQYSLAGTEETLSEMMRKLGYEREKDVGGVADQTVFRGDKLTHRDIYDAFQASLSETERKNLQRFLQQFRREIEVPDNVRQKRLEEYQKDYEQKINELHKGDIEQALESLAQGFLALTKIVDESQTVEKPSKEESQETFVQEERSVQIPKIALIKETPIAQTQSRWVKGDEDISRQAVFGDKSIGIGKQTQSPQLKIEDNVLSSFLPNSKPAKRKPDLVLQVRTRKRRRSLDSKKQLPFSSITARDIIAAQIDFNRAIFSAADHPQPRREVTRSPISAEIVYIRSRMAAKLALMPDFIGRSDQTILESDLTAGRTLSSYTLSRHFWPEINSDGINFPTTIKDGALSKKQKLSLLQKTVFFQLLSEKQFEDIFKLDSGGKKDQTRRFDSSTGEIFSGTADTLPPFAVSDTSANFESQIFALSFGLVEQLDKFSGMDYEDEADNQFGFPPELEERIMSIGLEYLNLFFEEINLQLNTDTSEEERLRQTFLFDRLLLLITLYQDEFKESETKQYIALLLFYEIQTTLFSSLSDDLSAKTINQKIGRLLTDTDSRFFLQKVDDLVAGAEYLFRYNDKERLFSGFAPRSCVILFLLCVFNFKRYSDSAWKEKDIVCVLRKLELLGRRIRQIKAKKRHCFYTVEKIANTFNRKNIPKMMKKKKKRRKVKFPKSGIIFIYQKNLREA